MLYVAGGFGSVEELKDGILKYAVFLGIPPTPDRVHFDDEPSLLTAPKVLHTPDVLQRDTFPT